MRAAAYARFSSDNQREESIDAQLRAIREYCERNGYELVKEYVDEARSATTDKRPAFQQMIADSARNEFDLLVVHKLDRFSRDRFDSAFYRRELKKNGVAIKSVLENLDGSPESIILESVLEGMAEYYSKNLAREVMKGLKETAYQCKFTGGTPPLGYDIAPDNTHIINDKEAESIRIIFKMYADGKGYTDIINALADYRTKAGNKFGKNSIADILRNEKYRGVYTYNRTGTMPNGKRNNHATKASEDIIRIPGGIPRIIDDETWERVQNRLHDNKRNASNRAKTVYILSGKLVCGECGAKFVARTTRHGDKVYSYYICGSKDRKNKECDMPRIIKQDIEQQVLDSIENLLDIDVESSVDAVMKMFENIEEPQEVVTARKELKKIEKAINGILDAIKLGAVHHSLVEELNRLQTEQERYTRIAAYKRELPTRDEIREFLESGKRIKEKAPEEQKSIIDRLIEKIVVYADHYDVKMRIRINASAESLPHSKNLSDGGASLSIPRGAHHPHHPYVYFTRKLYRKSRY